MGPDELRALSGEEKYKNVQALQESSPDRTNDRREIEGNGLVEQQRLFQRFHLSAGKFERILGVCFFNGAADEAVDYIARVRGYTVVPAAPALARMDRDRDYARALTEADLAIADSGFMVLLWRILRGKKIVRTSGLKYLKLLLADPALHLAGKTFLVLPSERAREKALTWLQLQGLNPSKADTYIAPRYKADVVDESLVETLNRRQPTHVIVGIGGGTQEKLGYYLREHLNYRPAIHCIGAALGFLTGDQPPIPMWADKFYLGWLLRLLRQPRLYSRRYLSAFRLPGLICRYGENAPRQG